MPIIVASDSAVGKMFTELPSNKGKSLSNYSYLR